MPSLILKFAELIKSPSRENPISNSFKNESEELSKLYTEFSKKLKDVPGIKQKIEILRLSGEKYNPLNVENLLIDALMRLERCVMFDEAHLQLKKETTTVLERLFIHQNIKVKNMNNLLERSKDGISETEIEASEFIGKAAYREAEISTYSYRQLKTNEGKNSAYKAQTKACEHLTYIQGDYIDGRNQASADLANPSKYPDPKARAGLLLEEGHRESLDYSTTIAKHSTNSGYKSSITNELNSYFDYRNRILKCRHLKDHLLEEKTLFNSIIATYSQGGVLDLKDRWKSLVNSYQREYASAILRMESLTLGLHLLFPNEKWENIDCTKPLSDMVISLKNTADLLKRNLNLFQPVTLQFSLKSLLSPKAFKDLAAGQKMTFSLPNLLQGKEVICRNINIISADSLESSTIIELTPPNLSADHQAIPILMQTLPLEYKQTDLATPAHNVPLNGEWHIKSSDTVSKDLVILIDTIVRT